MKKLQKTSRILDIIAKLIFWLLILFAVTLTGVSLAGVYHLYTYSPAPTDYIVGEALSFGNLTFSVVPGVISHTLDIRLSLTHWIIMLCGSAFVCILLKIIRNILRPMKEARPFDTAVSKNLKRLSWIVLIGGAVISAVSLYLEKLFFQAYDLEHLFLSDIITACTENYVYDCNFLIGFAFLYLLSYIFQYGEELQRQSDETL